MKILIQRLRPFRSILYSSLCNLCLSVVLVSCAGPGFSTKDETWGPTADPYLGDWQGNLVASNGTVTPVVAQLVPHAGGQYTGNILSRFDARENPLAKLEGEIDNGILKLTSANDASDPSQAAVSGGEMNGTLRGKIEGAFRMKHVVRMAPTIGAKPPEGALVLFDGTSLASWCSVDSLASEARWTLRDGCMEVRPGAGGIVTRKKFTDIQLHIEFRTPFMPAAEGQARGNSGVYVQGRYEVQVLDSYGLEGRDNECGGIYQVAAPAVNMCAPPGQWQSYDITFTAPRFDASGNKVQDARLTVVHNGVLVHEGFRLPAPTPGGIEQNVQEPGGIALQDHGNLVQYRNIWLVEGKTSP